MATLTSSNSYILTLSEANSLVDDNVLNQRGWDDDSSTDNRKIVALIEATRRIDRLNFLGVLKDLSQKLQFPRKGDSVVPNDIKLATVLIADILLDDYDPEFEYNLLRSSGSKYDSVSESFNNERVPEHLVAGIPSVEAWRYLKPYINDNQLVRVDRVS